MCCVSAPVATTSVTWEKEDWIILCKRGVKMLDMIVKIKDKTFVTRMALIVSVPCTAVLFSVNCEFFAGPPLLQNSVRIY